MAEDGSLCYFEEDAVSNPTNGRVFRDVLSEAMTRRESLGRLAAWVGATTLCLGSSPASSSAANALGLPGLTFPELQRGLDETARVADGYRWQVLAAWGDPIFKNAPGLDVWQQSGESQLRQFGYNCDFIAFLPLASRGRVERGLDRKSVV